ncbi:MAG: GSCFA domain-containing protein [Runella sp.]
MNTFRTELALTESPDKIGLRSSVLTLGSCFAEVVGRQLQAHKISTLVNPFGTIFNPISLVELLENTIEERPFLPEHFLQHQEVWFHYDAHSSLWGHSHEALQQTLETLQQEVRIFLQKTEFLLLTLGTAWVYRHKSTDKLVANCHKTPSSYFDKQLLEVSEITAAFTRLGSLLERYKPSLKILLTVSPVRHTRDTLPLNAVSKATLRLACHQLTQISENVFYFPAYEILLDDLRDYRFYKSDLIHPSELAEQYIFEQFGAVYFDNDLKKFVKEWQKIQQALSHRPLQPNTTAHKHFLEALLKKLHALAQRGINVQQEIEAVRNRIAV